MNGRALKLFYFLFAEGIMREMLLFMNQDLSVIASEARQSLFLTR